MRKIAWRGVVSLLAIFVFSAAPALGHRPDLINGSKAGPIRVDETTLQTAEEWFGEADTVRRVVVGCKVPLKRARWFQRLVIFFGRGSDGTATEVKVKQRTITSTAHGDITVHTRKGLQIGDREGKLRRLYPDATRYRAQGRRWYILKSSPSYGRLEAAIEEQRVTILRNGPWEYC